MLSCHLSTLMLSCHLGTLMLQLELQLTLVQLENRRIVGNWGETNLYAGVDAAGIIAAISVFGTISSAAAAFIGAVVARVIDRISYWRQ
jgi:hypothetical protein